MVRGSRGRAKERTSGYTMDPNHDASRCICMLSLKSSNTIECAYTITVRNLGQEVAVSLAPDRRRGLVQYGRANGGRGRRSYRARSVLARSGEPRRWSGAFTGGTAQGPYKRNPPLAAHRLLSNTAAGGARVVGRGDSRECADQITERAPTRRPSLFAPEDVSQGAGRAPRQDRKDQEQE